jgi:hypothetical protein
VIHFLVPCGAAKAAAPAPAAELYVSSTFRLVLAAALAQAACEDEARVWIVSAKHGLVALDQTLAPYDVRMGDVKAIDATELAWQIAARFDPRDEVYAFLPKAYLTTVELASELADGPLVHDVYETAPGIGYQRGVAAILTHTATR